MESQSSDLQAVETLQAKAPAIPWFKTRAAILVGFFGVVGLAVRLYVLAKSRGSNDMRTWEFFSHHVEHSGVRFCYENIGNFNHPPLMGYLVLAARKIAAALDTRLAITFKVPQLLAEALMAFLLWRTWANDKTKQAWVFAALATSLLGISISMHHGNTDALCVAMSFLAAYLLDRRRFFFSGLALAGAINVKLIPVLLIFPLLAQARSIKDAIRFLGGLSLGVIPFVPFIITSWPSFKANALSYNSNPERYGIYGLMWLGTEIRHLGTLVREVQMPYWTSGRYFIFAAIFALGIWGRQQRVKATALGLGTFAAFLVLTPGFGVQYLVYVLPFLLALDLRAGFLYSAFAGLSLVVTYVHFWEGTTPWFSHFTAGMPLLSVLLAFFAWAYLAGVTPGLIRRAAGANLEIAKSESA